MIKTGVEGIGIDKWGELQKKLKEENNLITKGFHLIILKIFLAENELKIKLL